jgi:hypothetical protein
MVNPLTRRCIASPAAGLINLRVKPGVSKRKGPPPVPVLDALATYKKERLLLGYRWCG